MMYYNANIGNIYIRILLWATCDNIMYLNIKQFLQDINLIYTIIACIWSI